MGRRERYAAGTFCAVDLVTGDVEGSKKFYASVLGWSAVDAEEYAYTSFRLDGARVAGAVPLSAEMRETGAPPAWTTYVSVDDLDGVAARAASLGGAALGEPLDLEGIGRTVPVADPGGGVLLLWQPLGFAGAEVVNGVGAWSWSDLQTPDPEGAVPFYEALFGWSITPVEASHGLYWSVANDGARIGGIMRAEQAPRPAWCAYFGVEDLDTALARVADAGGTTLLEPITVPSGRFALAVDPQGAVLGLIDGEYDD
jgi:uncharacterized protein